MNQNTLLLLLGFVSQVKVNGFASWIIQELKDSKAPVLRWISHETPWVTRGVAFVAASATAVGIHATFTGSTFTLTGLSFTAILLAAWNIAQNYLFQHAWYKMVFQPQSPVVVPVAVPAAVTLVPNEHTTT